jgi:hypothetical protein
LRAAITLDGRDAHLRDDFHDALDGGLDEILAGVLVLDALEEALMDHVIEGLEGEVRIDGAATVADEEREVMNFAGFTGFEDKADARARAFADEMMVQPRDGEQRGMAALSGVDAAVGQDENIERRL